jgi:hypothetical protein
LGITLALNTKAVEVNEHGVIGETVAERKVFGADTVALALGRVPRWDEADELRFCAPEFHQLGDCLAAKTIYESTRTAYNIAMDIASTKIVTG